MNTLLSVRDLKQHFRLGGGFLRKHYTVYAVDGISFDLKQGGDAWAGRGVRLWQVHPGAFTAQVVRADCRHHQFRGAGYHQALDQRDAFPAPGDADGVSGSCRIPQ